jgi:hypothetical protein
MRWDRRGTQQLSTKAAPSSCTEPLGRVAGRGVKVKGHRSASRLPACRAEMGTMNLQRRNLTKDQQAMAMAMMYPDGDERGRGKKGETRKLLENSNFKRDHLDRARAVLRYSRPLAEEVLKGVIGLDEALQQVRTEEAKARSRQTQIDELRTKTVDLADKVNEGRMKFDDAMAEYHRRLLDEQRIREGVAQAFDGLIKFPGYVAGLRQAIDAGRRARQQTC